MSGKGFNIQPVMAAILISRQPVGRPLSDSIRYMGIACAKLHSGARAHKEARF